MAEGVNFPEPPVSLQDVRHAGSHLLGHKILPLPLWKSSSETYIAESFRVP